jgi:hypothetical protein
MSILVLETNPAQVETIRDIVCNVLGTDLTLVDSIDDALEALQTTTPDLVLLPALLSPEEEAKLVTFLRQDPKGAHVDTLFTPVMGRKDKSTEPSTRGWLRWSRSRSASDAGSIDEVALFTERLTWSLQSARERRRLEEELSAEAYGVDEHDTSSEPSAAAADKEIPLEAAVADAPILDGAAELATSSAASHSERRAHRRFHAHELQALRASRVAGGSAVNVRDVSAGGALLESDAPLSGNFGVLVLTTGAPHAVYVPFRVVRHQIESQGNVSRYVEACAFLEPFDVSGLQGREASPDVLATSDDGIFALGVALEPYLTGQTSDERRRHVRVDGPFDGCRRGPIDMPIMIHNLSQGGCFVDSRLAVDDGRSMTIGLRSVDGEWFDVAAEVVHNQPGVGFALRFLERSDVIRDRLARIIAQRTAGVEARDTTAA